MSRNLRRRKTQFIHAPAGYLQSNAAYYLSSAPTLEFLPAYSRCFAFFIDYALNRQSGSTDLELPNLLLLGFSEYCRYEIPAPKDSLVVFCFLPSSL